MELIDRGILIEDTLIVGDFHLGMEEHFRNQGILVPRIQFQKLLKDIQTMLEKTQAKKLVINGDVKHEFSRGSDQEWREFVKLIDALSIPVHIVKGNHDTVMNILAKKKNIPISNHLLVHDVYVCHGDVIPKDEQFKKAKTVVISHEHPAITLREGAKYETYKCFLKTLWKGKTLYVLPSFSPLTEGTDVSTQKLLSPFLKEVKSVEVIVTQHGVLYPFGTVELV